MSEDEDDIDYTALPKDEKLNLILSKVTLNEARFRKLEKNFDKVCSQQKHIKKLDSVVVSHADRIRLLEYKSVDLEAKSRRNNLLFYGRTENRNDDCKTVVCKLIKDHFDIEITENATIRAHRIGRYDE